jgi:type II restriction enzyme
MFQCADLICEFCGDLAQVTTHRTPTPDVLPKTILGAA